MYWTFNGTRVKTPTIPFHKIGTNQDFNMTLVTEAGEDLDKTYLCVATENHAGTLSAKLSGGSTYKSIMGLFNANCQLGQIAASTSTVINFRLNVSSGTSEGGLNILLVVGHDDGAEIPNPHYSDADALWFDLDELADVEWRDLEDM